MSGNLLEVKDLVIHYTSDKEELCAVNGVSFNLGAKEVIGFVGETGAGKTTTAMGIMRLIPNPPGKVLGGEIIFQGRNLLELSEAEMREIRGNKITMIFQDPMTSLNPVLTIGDQIAEVVLLHNKISKKEAMERARDMLEMVGIPGQRCDEYPHQFSGGMKQRVVIAIALACSPALLIADEPTTALDVTIQAQVLELMRQLKDEFQTSMIMITHDLGVVSEICDKVAIVYAGEIIETGMLEEIYENHKHPYTDGLFNSIPDLDEDVEWLPVIKGHMPLPSHLPDGCKFHPRCPHAMDICKQENPARPCYLKHT
jgi:peptide/nickel transport system ATP-binding protein